MKCPSLWGAVLCAPATAQLPLLFVCCSHCGCILAKLNTKHKHQQLEGTKIGHGTGQLVEIVPEKYPPEGVLGCQSIVLSGRSILEGHSGCSKQCQSDRPSELTAEM